MSALSVLTVDDEPLALLRLEQAFPNVEGVVHVGAAFCCSEALDKIKRLKPDVVLLDICLRDGLGFDIVESLPAECASTIVFVTAYDSYAARAFEANAVDYVLKPVSAARLNVAFERVRERMASRAANAELAELRAAVADLRRRTLEPPRQSAGARYWLKGRGGDLFSVCADEIDWINVEDDYVRLHTRFGEYLMRCSIRTLLNEIDATKFVRVRRNAVVRRAAIRAIRHTDLGATEVELTNGARIRAGRVHARTLWRELHDKA